jgi:hypothetical protein
VKLIFPNPSLRFPWGSWESTLSDAVDTEMLSGDLWGLARGQRLGPLENINICS